MRRFHGVFAVVGLLVVGLALTGPSAWGSGNGQEPAKKGKVELPPAVAKAVKDNVPNAQIESVTVDKETGITLYDIEFKAGRGEIEVAEDGTVMDVAMVIALKDVPKPAAEAIHKAAAGATINQVEKSEVRAEIKKEGGKGTLVKLAAPLYVYEAELVKDGQKYFELQIQVKDKRIGVTIDPSGKIIE